MAANCTKVAGNAPGAAKSLRRGGRPGNARRADALDSASGISPTDRNGLEAITGSLVSGGERCRRRRSALKTLIARGAAAVLVNRRGQDRGMMGTLFAAQPRTDPAIDSDR